MRDTGPGFQAVVWLPVEGIAAIVSSDAQPSKERVDQLLSPLEAYLIVMAVDLPGGMREPGASREELGESLVLIDSIGAFHRPIPDDELDPFLRRVMAQLAPLLKASMGNLGQAFQIFAFPRVVDPLSPGRVSIKIADSEFSWRLPIGALSRPRRCPVDDEELNGAWEFCPWHGVPLK